MPRAFELTVCACVVGCLVPNARAQEASPGGASPLSLTLDQAVALAVRNNPSEAIAIHSELSARQNYLSQSAPVNPTVSYSGLNNSVAPFSGFGNGSNYAAYATVETSGRWRYRTDQARWEYVAAKENTRGAHVGLLQGVTAAYVGLQTAKADLESEQENWDDTKKLADLAAGQFKLGAAPETNSIRADIALKQEDQNLVRAKTSLELAQQTLDNELGLDPHRGIVAADPLRYRPDNFDPDELKRLALSHRYELLSGIATEKSLESTIGLNRAGYFPDLIFGSDFDGPVEIGLTIPIDLGSIRSSVSKAREDLKVQQATDEKERQQVLLDVASAYANLVQAQRVVNSFRADELPEAQSLYTKVLAGYKLGANTILDVLDAQSTLRTARTGLNDAIGAYNNALSQLIVAVGMPMEQIESTATKRP